MVLINCNMVSWLFSKHCIVHFATEIAFPSVRPSVCLSVYNVLELQADILLIAESIDTNC